MRFPFPDSTPVQPKLETYTRTYPRAVFDAPFYDEGRLAHRANSGPAVLLRTEREHDARGELRLAGLIFHTAHCGSTLLARMLAAVPHVRVVSEPEALNGIFLSQRFFALGDQEVEAHLRAVMSAFCARTDDGERDVVIKLTSWNVFFFRAFQNVFPDVPKLYIDRDTDDAVRSLLATGRGFVDWWNHPTDLPARFFIGEGVVPDSRENYVRQMLLAHRRAAQQHAAEGLKAIRYPGFIETVTTEILPFFGLDASEMERAMVQTQAVFDSKTAVQTQWTG